MDRSFLDHNVSNMDAVLKSVERDYYVYKWFLFLLNRREIRARLSKEKKAKSCYVRLQLMTALQALVLFYTISSLFTLTIFLFQSPALWVFVLGAGPLVWGLSLLKRKVLVRLVEAFLSGDFAQNPLGHQTLYQLSEDYSRRFAVASLIDTMYASETAMKTAWKIAYIAAFCVLAVQVWVAFLLFPLILLLVFCWVNSTANYRRLGHAR